MNDALRRSAAHVFVARIEMPELETEDRHHLSRVLRLRDGEAVSCSDGCGGWRECVWNHGGLSCSGEVHRTDQPAPLLTVAISPLKGDRTEMVVGKLVEIGIDRIVVVASTARGVVRWSPDKAARALERLSRVARAAAMQSRRVHLPEVVGPVQLGGIVSGGIGFAEPGGDATPEDVTTLVIGPEGGFSDEELEIAPLRVGLGDAVLRAETAAIVGAARMVAHRTASMRHTG